MLNFVLTIGAILVCLALFGLFILKYRYSLDDLDPFNYNNYWNDNIAPDHQSIVPINCKHKGGTTDVVQTIAVNCETINTLCNDCGQVLTSYTECL
ncbi:hypothetical protein [Formosa sp. A9]|uniref:hypothetical protein n=1 Tax=Formosa sp. A9 TaxID=3442641 RepID=UPI003EBBD327